MTGEVVLDAALARLSLTDSRASQRIRALDQRMRASGYHAPATSKPTKGTYLSLHPTAPSAHFMLAIHAYHHHHTCQLASLWAPLRLHGPALFIMSAVVMMKRQCVSAGGAGGSGVAAAAVEDAQTAMLFPPHLRPHALLLQAADSHCLNAHLQRCAGALLVCRALVCPQVHKVVVHLG